MSDPFADPPSAGSGAWKAPASARPAGPGFWRSRAARFLMLGLITLLLGAPLLMVGLIGSEREYLHRQTSREIGAVWGGEQTLIGPALAIPFDQRERRSVGSGEDRRTEIVTTRRIAVFLPRELAVAGETEAEIRRRGIYETPVYAARAALSGEFDAAPWEGFFDEDQTPLWDRAFVSIQISDPRAFRENMSLDWGGRSLKLLPGASLSGAAGLHAPVGDPREGGAKRFSTELAFNGSGSLFFAPLGETSRVTLKGDWPHPGFGGAFLPVEREVSPTGFTASWSVPYVARSLPQSFVEGETASLNSYGAERASAFGLTFAQPASPYQQVERALKYGLLFVAMTLVTVFLIETQGRRPAHAVQYLLIGLAQCVFFLLLLAFSEHMGFAVAYGIAAAATIGLITLYVFAGLKLGRAGWTVFGLLTVIYAFLYLLLRNQDYALLIGAVAAFAALAGTMWTTRDVDWRAAAVE
ncbi:cell envelope integrity protein CreD [Neomegalonema sp.]|uniref:cell envelope integrity protein CreD n=1 Tax=Neomegalonema sp. TaxID=2039713 RepID=UPI00262C175D|nr:cell envelope integrity protein CreD [Neomegalonema sp.]MDD2868070.1 cell envelope integrity protein CreD [Neomegalonema sp.]